MTAIEYRLLRNRDNFVRALDHLYADLRVLYGRGAEDQFAKIQQYFTPMLEAIDSLLLPIRLKSEGKTEDTGTPTSRAYKQ